MKKVIKLAINILRGCFALTVLTLSVVCGMTTGNTAKFVFAIIVGVYIIVAIDFSLGLISDMVES